MSNLIIRSIQKVLADYDLNIVKTKRLTQLVRAEELAFRVEQLLPESGTSGPDYVPNKKLGNVGFSLNMERQIFFLQTLDLPEYRELFRSLREDESINIGFGGKDYRSQGLIHNGCYPNSRCGAIRCIHCPLS